MDWTSFVAGMAAGGAACLLLAAWLSTWAAGRVADFLEGTGDAD